MRKRILTLGIVMCVIGVAFTVAARLLTPQYKVDQAWMEQRAPVSVGDYQFVPSPANPQESNLVDQATWDTLLPFGIVDRIYKKGDGAFEAMLIAGDKRETFHDPNVCLPSQGLGLVDEHEENIQTKTRGAIHVTVAKLNPPDGSQPSWIAYFYRVQDKFLARGRASIFILTLAMFKGPLLHGNFDMNTVFYRFISMKPQATKEEFLQFVADFMDKAGETSKGYF
jgi:hypothetical protein